MKITIKKMFQAASRGLRSDLKPVFTYTPKGIILCEDVRKPGIIVIYVQTKKYAKDIPDMVFVMAMSLSAKKILKLEGYYKIDDSSIRYIRSLQSSLGVVVEYDPHHNI